MPGLQPIRGLLLGVVALGLGAIATLKWGTSAITWSELSHALWHFSGTHTDGVVRSLRLPRSLLAGLVGSGLAIAGTLTQAITQNPLASPQLLGINSGAALAVVILSTVRPRAPDRALILAGLLGSAIATLLIYALAQGTTLGGEPRVRLTLGGVTLSAAFAALTTGILVLHQGTLDEIRFWLVGSLARSPCTGLLLLPFWAVGVAIALSLARSLTVLSLGGETAQGLGVPVGWVRGWAVVATVLLAGSSVAIAGPIGFIGLMVPHGVKFWTGQSMPDLWQLGLAGLWGGVILLWADGAARWLFAPQDIPVGIILPLLGVPVLFVLLRRLSSSP